MSKREYTYGEEIANYITHFIGSGLSIAGLTLLIIRAVNKGNISHIISFTIFGVALILSYALSGSYHIVSSKKVVAKKVMKILDHAAIYVLIAGTYTPFLITVIKGKEAWILFYIQWVLVLVGIFFETKITGKYTYLTTGVYLAMGWMIISVFTKLKIGLNPVAFKLLVSGGIVYTLGTIFYVMKKVPYTHMIWHLFVIGGGVLHFLSVYLSI